MANEMDRFHRELQNYLDKNGADDMDDNRFNELLQSFMRDYNEQPRKTVTKDNAEAADDFLELAEDADDQREALQYAQKALFLEPDNLDARRCVAVYSSTDLVDKVMKLEKAVQLGDEQMEKEGYLEESCIGDYWLIFETRPYMRLLDVYMTSLMDTGMYGKACEVGEKMVRLCTADNLGVRYTLMNLYALLENEDGAQALLKQFEEHDEGQLLLPLSVLYFKLYRLDRAKEYLDRLVRINRDTKKFFRGLIEDETPDFFDDMSPYGYRPNTVEELAMALVENEFLYRTIPGFAEWAYSQLTMRRKK